MVIVFIHGMPFSKSSVKTYSKPKMAVNNLSAETSSHLLIAKTITVLGIIHVVFSDRMIRAATGDF